MESVNPTIITFMVGTVIICLVVQRLNAAAVDDKQAGVTNKNAILVFVGWSLLFLVAFSQTEQMHYLLTDGDQLPNDAHRSGFDAAEAR